MLETFFNLEIVKAAWPIILAGLGNTVLLSLVVVPLGLTGGLALAMLASVRKPWVRYPLMAWVDFFRAFPPLVLLIFLTLFPYTTLFRSESEERRVGKECKIGRAHV